MEKKYITCPHCLSDIPHGASVCCGCKAEVEYGTPNSVFVYLFLISATIGYFIAYYLHKIIPNDVVSYTVWIITTIFFCYFFGKKALKYYADKIRFKRAYMYKK